MKKFKVHFENDMTIVVEGPRDYLASDHYRRTLADLESGRHPLIEAAPTGTPLARLLEVVFQTDHAAWLGARQLERAAERTN